MGKESAIGPIVVIKANRIQLVGREAPALLPTRAEGWWIDVSTRKRLPDPLVGGLTRPLKPTLYGTHSDIFQGWWTKSSGERVPVIIKAVRAAGLDWRIRAKERFEKRLAREIFIWNATNHENILRFIGYQISEEGQPLLISPYYMNGTLERYIRANPEVKYNQRLKLLQDAARGLRYLHKLEHPVAHGGIRPSDILITDDLRAVLCDFGNSRIMTPSHSGFTTSKTTPGAAGFQAKEIIVGSTLATPMSDVYGLGGVILNTMSGKPPFHTLVGAAAVYFAVFRDETPVPIDYPELPESDPLWNLMRGCWSPNPLDRPTVPQIIYKLHLFADCGSGFTGPLQLPAIATSTNALTDLEESAAQSGTPLPPLSEPLLGTLKIVEYVGRGGYGEVHRGFWTAPGKDSLPVAIKRLKIVEVGVGLDQNSDFLIRRIRRETVIWKAAEHPNVLKLYGYQIVDGNPMFVSPWCKNGDLWSFVTKHPELTRKQKLKLLLGAGRALAHLHTLQPPICHGDVKPQNVVIGDNMEALLCDFGISRIITGPGVTGMTTGGGTTGTAGFGAKEVLQGLRPIKESDVYAFGGLILATMTGKRPFYKEPNDPSIFIAIFMDKTPQPTDYPEISPTDPLWDLMKKCWLPELSNRPSMAQVVAELKEIDRCAVDGLYSEAGPTGV